jgi:hypothetical protein
MNKNTTILVGAIAVLAIGVRAYVSMSSPSNEWFSTQWVKKTTSPIPPTTNPNQPTSVPVGEVDDWGNDDWGNDGWGTEVSVDYYKGWTCLVAFDDGNRVSWTTSENWGGTCCKVDWICYNWREPWVSVQYGDPMNDKKMLDADNYK